MTQPSTPTTPEPGSPPLPERWLRGPVAHIPLLLQPVAHSLLQARDEVHNLASEFPDEKLWERPGGAASAGFHLQHITGVLDRMFTYARGASLDNTQRRTLENEGNPPRPDTTARDLYPDFNRQIEMALDQLRVTTEDMLGDPRKVGRQGMPSTVQGLLFHAAEHVQRHLGQLLVTVRIVAGDHNAGDHNKEESS